MTLFFNWNNLVKLTQGDPIKVLKTLRLFENKKLIINKQKLKGHSYLLNPIPILYNKDVDILYVYQYLLLAAKRDYAMYKLYGIKYLPIMDFQQLNKDKIKQNPLLKVEETGIHFKYE